MIKISKPSKMKITGKRVGCWSLEARKSCPGSKNSDGSVVDVCQSCYATKGTYRFPVVKAARQSNKEDYKKDDWVERMVEEVKKYDYFRWFDSGDIETSLLAARIHLVIEATPDTKHWLPTRSDKLSHLNFHIAKRQLGGRMAFAKTIAALPNVAVRLSADNIGFDKPERKGVNSYVIRPTDLFEAQKRGIKICPVTKPGSTQKSCDTCTTCYTDQPVAYMIH